MDTGTSKVESAVMKDPVVKAAIKHSGDSSNKPSASDISSQKARQSEASLRTKGQRTTSMLWEETQKNVAISTVRTTLAVAGVTALFGSWLTIAESVRMGAFIFLYGVANLVIGFYFGRTNHQRVGGPGGDSVIGTR